MFDAAIIGAGPAGATLARLIGKTHKVLLADKRPFSDTSAPAEGKCCGGLLAPDAQRTLSELGLGLPGHVLEAPQLFAVKAIDLQHRLARNYQRYYINMDRQAFDKWLLSLVPSSVEIRTGLRFQHYVREKGSFEIAFRQGKSTFVEKARVLIGADGASSRVRLQAAPGGPFPARYLAIQERVECRDVLPYFTAIFAADITDYYCWTIPKNDCLLIGAALSMGAGAAGRFEAFKQRLRGTGVEFGKTVCRQGAFIMRPMSTGQLFTGRDGLAFIGEAAGWISPSSAEGISYAFRSARHLAEALICDPDRFEESYRLRARELKRNVALKIVKAGLLFNPLFRKIVMKSGIQSVEINRSQIGS